MKGRKLLCSQALERSPHRAGPQAGGRGRGGRGEYRSGDRGAREQSRPEPSLGFLQERWGWTRSAGNSSDGLWALGVVSSCPVPDSGIIREGKDWLGVCVSWIGGGEGVQTQDGLVWDERGTPGQVVLTLGRAVSPRVCKAVDARASRKQEKQSSFNWSCDEWMPNRQILNLRKHRTCVAHL